MMAGKHNGTTGDKKYTLQDWRNEGNRLHNAVKHWESTGEIPIAIAKDLKILIINFMVVSDSCIKQGSKTESGI